MFSNLTQITVNGSIWFTFDHFIIGHHGCDNMVVGFVSSPIQSTPITTKVLCLIAPHGK
jgi:hypothetical protein